MIFLIFKKGIFHAILLFILILNSYAQERTTVLALSDMDSKSQQKNKLYAYERDLKFSHLTVEDGLPSNTVNAVIKDSRGFIWMATENGVCRYDGYTFINFRSDEEDSFSIQSNIVYVVYEDNKQRIWVGSEKGLDLYNRDTDRFEGHFFSGISMRSIYQDKSNKLWVGGDKGIYLYDEERKEFKKPFPHLFDNTKEVYNTVSSIAQDKSGNLWMGTPQGIYVYNFGNKKFKRYINDPKDPRSLSANDIRKIITDQNQQIWIATYGGGINAFNSTTGTFKRYLNNPEENNSLSNNLTQSIWEDETGKIWIGTDGNGIDVFDPDKKTFRHFLHTSYNSKSLNNNVIRCITGDGRGGVWVGTYAGGINFFNQNAEAFVHYKVPTFNGISSVMAFSEDKKGNIWIGTDGGGLSYFDRSLGKFTNYIHIKRKKNGLSDNRIMSLLIDHQENLWIGTYLGGLCRFNPQTNTFTTYSTNDKSSLSDNIIWCLLEDSKKRIWAGTNHGLNLYDQEKNKFTPYTIVNSNLSNNMVRSLHEDSEKRIWVATQDGLNLFDEKTKDFIVIRNEPNKANSLSSNWIKTINSDYQGNLWVGTFEGGLNVFEESKNAFISFKEKNGLPDNMISGILGDERGNLWIATRKGLARLEIKTGKIKSYFVNDGLQDNHFNHNAFLKTRKGEFLFGGSNGFSLFVPEEALNTQHNEFPPQLALTGFKIFNKEVPINHSASPLKKHINETTNIVMPYHQSVLTFEFVALNFIKPERNQYAYRLLGFENNWNYIGNKRSATYTNLASGEYTFEVKASNNEGVWSTQNINLKITIMPPFWETWWFKSIVLLFVIIVGSLIFRNVKSRIQEKIRTSKLIAELEIKALIAQMNPHFIFNCLNSIQELILINKQDQATYYLDKFSKLLRNLLQGSEKNFITLEDELTLLELYLELEALRFDQQFHYDIDIDPQIDLEEVIIPSFLIQPFVENALWHGLMNKKGPRNLSVYFKLHSHNVLMCKIMDDGIGREEASRIKKNNFTTGNQSFGIRIIKERIKFMKKQDYSADLKIVDEMDEDGKSAGTTVVIKIPVGIRNFRDPISGYKMNGTKVKERINHL
ncbi:MAG TPA: two-component regulator propeller domain-containing protein [Cytophagales bacterium]|nr:two-component regulator propeller domain-containing protein [Cytophagales bacterium]